MKPDELLTLEENVEYEATLTGVRNGKEFSKDVVLERNYEDQTWVFPLTTKTIFGTSTLYYRPSKRGDVLTTYSGEVVASNVKFELK